MDQQQIAIEYAILIAVFIATLIAITILSASFSCVLRCAEQRPGSRKATAIDDATSSKLSSPPAPVTDAMAIGRYPILRLMLERLRYPLQLLLPLVAVRIVMNERDVIAKDSAFNAFDWIMYFATVIAVCLFLIAVFDILTEMLLTRYRMDVTDNLSARMVHTRFRILHRFVCLLVILIGTGMVLMSVESIRSLSAGLLAMSGILGLVVALAASPTLTNLFAGLQIAIAQPIRLDDVVIIDGEWGRVEEITSTYVVVAIWDQRRLIVPFSRITSQVFQNWTRTTSAMLGTVFLYVDYTVDVNAVRTELTRILKEAPEWDGRVAVLQVTDCKERTMELRGLVSAANSSLAWDLRCFVREKLLDFIQSQYPSALTRERISMCNGPPNGLSPSDVAAALDPWLVGSASPRSRRGDREYSPARWDPMRGLPSGSVSDGEFADSTSSMSDPGKENARRRLLGSRRKSSRQRSSDVESIKHSNRRRGRGAKERARGMEKDDADEPRGSSTSSTQEHLDEVQTRLIQASAPNGQRGLVDLDDDASTNAPLRRRHRGNSSVEQPRHHRGASEQSTVPPAPAPALATPPDISDDSRPRASSALSPPPVVSPVTVRSQPPQSMAPTPGTRAAGRRPVSRRPSLSRRSRMSTLTSAIHTLLSQHRSIKSKVPSAAPSNPPALKTPAHALRHFIDVDAPVSSSSVVDTEKFMQSTLVPNLPTPTNAAAVVAIPVTVSGGAFREGPTPSRNRPPTSIPSTTSTTARRLPKLASSMALLNGGVPPIPPVAVTNIVEDVGAKPTVLVPVPQPEPPLQRATTELKGLHVDTNLPAPDLSQPLPVSAPALAPATYTIRLPAVITNSTPSQPQSRTISQDIVTVNISDVGNSRGPRLAPAVQAEKELASLSEFVSPITRQNLMEAAKRAQQVEEIQVQLAERIADINAAGGVTVAPSAPDNAVAPANPVRSPAVSAVPPVPDPSSSNMTTRPTTSSDIHVGGN